MYSRLLISLVIFLHMWSCTLTGFAEIPSDEKIELGSVELAVCRCRHTSPEVNIGWRVNGSPVGQFPDFMIGSITENGTVVETLTIPVRSEYNGTEVVCVAFFYDGSPTESTPPATLMFHSGPKTTTSAPMTLPDPFTEFVSTPLPLNVTVDQGQATFHCQHRSSDGITWRVLNGASNYLSNTSIEGVRIGGGGFRSSLSIATLLIFNKTTVQCVATIFTGSTPTYEYTLPVTLLIQDIPGNISNIRWKRDYYSGILTTCWDPLHTLDLTGRDPDIIYHVEIFKSTCGQNVLMSDENVTESVANNTLDLMEIYTAFVTPRNNVPGYIDGPRVVTQGLDGAAIYPECICLILKNDTPVPYYYTMILDSLDGIAGNLSVNISIKRDGEMINMLIGEPLPPKRLWMASILPHNCKTDVQMTELSTHDIQNITISSNILHPGQIRVVGFFVDGSTVTGALLIIYSLTNESDIQYVDIAKQLEQNRIMISRNLTDLTGSEYGVSIFALEDGLPFPRVVTSPTNVPVADDYKQERARLQSTSSSIHFKLNPTLTGPGVCITCTFLDNSTTDCVAVVHQRISQLSSSGLMNIEASHKFTRFGDTAYGCIEGVDLELYQVGVMGGSRFIIHSSDPKSSKCLGCIIGIVNAAVLGMVVLVGILLSVLIFCIKRCSSQQSDGKSPAESEVTVEMQKCGAYEVLRLSRQRVTMKDNPAYVDVNLCH